MNKHFKVLKHFLPSKKALIIFTLCFLISLIINYILKNYGGETINQSRSLLFYINLLIVLSLSPIIYFLGELILNISKIVYSKYSLYNCFYSIKPIEDFELYVNQFKKFHKRVDELKNLYINDVYRTILRSEEYKKIEQDILSLARKEFNKNFEILIVNNGYEESSFGLEELKEFKNFIVFEKETTTSSKLIIEPKDI